MNEISYRVLEFQVDYILSGVDVELRKITFVFPLHTFFKISNNGTDKIVNGLANEMKKAGILECEVLAMFCYDQGHWFLAKMVAGAIHIWDSMFQKERCKKAFVAVRDLLMRIGGAGNEVCDNQLVQSFNFQSKRRRPVPYRLTVLLVDVADNFLPA